MDIEALRHLVREMKAGQTLIMAPDVYDALAAGCNLEQEVMGVAGSHSIRIQRSVALKPGTAMIMAEAHFDAPKSWAGDFLAKSGPGPKKTTELIDIGLIAPQDAMAYAAGLSSAPPPPRPAPGPKVRQRVVDT